jgi:hypothetical protein
VALSGRFFFTHPRPLFQSGFVEGVIAGQQVVVRLVRSTGLSTKSVDVDGLVGETPIKLEGSLGISGRFEGYIVGSVGVGIVDLLIDQVDSRATIDGTFGGPIEVCMTVVLTVVRFLGYGLFNAKVD